MYCSSCGVAVPQGLSYCNYCGAKLSDAKGHHLAKSSEVRPESLISAMVALFIFGLGAITVLMAVLKVILRFNEAQILTFALLSFLSMLVMEGVLIRLLLRRTSGTEAADDTVTLKGPATKELDQARARALPESIPSVTENTTRAFEPTYVERTSKNRT